MNRIIDKSGWYPRVIIIIRPRRARRITGMMPHVPVYWRAFIIMAGRESESSSSSSSLHAARSALSAIARLDKDHEVLLPLAPGVLAWGCVARPALARFKSGASGGDDWLAVSAVDGLIAAEADAALRREEAALDAAAAAEATEAAALARNSAARAALAAALGGGKVLSDVTHSDGARVRVVEEDGEAVSYITEPFDASERRGGGERVPAAAANKKAPPRARLSDAEFAMILARLEGGAAKEAAAEARPPATPARVGESGVRREGASAAASPSQPPTAAATASAPGPLGDVRERLRPAGTPQDAASGSASASAPEAAAPRMSRFLAARRGLL
jgi:hypothetical protein